MMTQPDQTPVPEPIQPLTVFFREHGRKFAINNSEPLDIEDPLQVHLVVSGGVEIFGVPSGQNGVDGARENFLSVSPGEVFWGIPPGDTGVRMVASGVMGTTVERLPLELFIARANEPDFRAPCAAAVNQWVEKLSERLASNAGSPQIDILLKPDSTLQPPPSARLGSPTYPVWVAGANHDFLFLGVEPVYSSSDFIPLARGCWLSYETSGSSPDGAPDLACFSTIDGLAKSELWDGLLCLNKWLVQILSHGMAFELADEVHRGISKRKDRQGATTNAVQHLLSVLEPESNNQGVFTGDRVDDLLLRAITPIANRLGIRVVRHADMKPSHDAGTNLSLLAKASRFRFRKVLLEGAWWDGNCGPMLGYRKESNSPVALLPLPDGGYALQDPKTGETRLDRQSAATLAPFAFSLYRSLPDGAVSAWKFVKFAARGLKREFRFIGVLSIGSGLLGMLVPFFTSKIFDSVIPGRDIEMLAHYVAAMLCAAIAIAGFSIVRGMAVLRVEGQMDLSGQSSIWSRILDLPVTYFRKGTAGDLADRAYAVDAIRSKISQGGVTAILGVSMAFFQGVMMLFLDLKLGMVALLLIFLMVAMVTTANAIQLRLQRKEYSIRGKIASIVLQLLTGVTKLRIAAAEDHALRVWASEFSKQKQVGFRVGRIQNLVELLKTGFPIIFSMVIFLTFAMQLKTGQAPLTTGQFIAFNGAATAVLTSLIGLAMTSLDMLEIIPIFERVSPILKEPAEVTDDRKHPGELKGNLEFYHVNFRYHADGPLILRNLDIKVRKGEFVALVGTSGSGKSTILRLLLGFEDPESGYVYYDGQDLRTLDLREVRKQVGTVLQTSRLMPTSIYQNIIGASTTLTLADAWTAARMSGLDKDIENMPMGMHTLVSEGGGGFSGGQKQRLMIARALVNHPRIVFFDEATSALDNRTQQIVTDSLKELDATRITIAHRLSTVVDADRIVVLDKGSVVEEGTYHELMEHRGLFYELAIRQQSEPES